MKKVFAICLLFFSSIAFADVEVTGSVTAVTLFQDRAEIARTAEAEVSAGTQVLRFKGVPESVSPESLRVKGRSSAALTILGVELRNRPLAYEASPRAKELELKIESTKRELTGLKKIADRIHSERELVTSISMNAEVPAQAQAVVRPRTAAEMGEMLGFIANSISRLDREAAENEKLSQDKSRELAVLERELGSLRPSKKSESVIEVSLSASAAGKADLELTYQVGAANWHPAYNLDAKEGGTGLAITLGQYAVMSQNTGEDWLDVALTLSTARPQVGLARPHPAPINVDVLPPYQPLYRGAGAAKISSMPQSRNEAADMAMGQESSLLAAPVAVDAIEQEATINQGAVITFKLPGTFTVKSDGSKQKVKLSDLALEASVLNVAVPSRTTEVYREATLKNTSTVPLLPGQVSVFVDGSFVGNNYLSYTPQGKEIQLPIGISSTVTAKRTQLKKFEDDSGLVRSFRRIAVEYELEIENISKHAEKIAVLEPAVVSKNEKITVKSLKLDPAPLAADAKERVAKEPGIVEWHFSLGAGEKKMLKTETSVEFESVISVSGLDGL